MNTRTTTKFTAALIEEATTASFFRALWAMKRGRVPAMPPSEQRAPAA